MMPAATPKLQRLARRAGNAWSHSHSVATAWTDVSGGVGRGLQTEGVAAQSSVVSPCCSANFTNPVTSCTPSFFIIRLR
jgi:hypothetical protein